MRSGSPRLLLRLFIPLVAATVTSTAPAAGQLPPLSVEARRSATIAAVEAEGAAFPRDSVVPPVPRVYVERSPEAEEIMGPLPTMLGGPVRSCVVVPTEDPLFVRSGEFLIGGHFSRLLHGRPSKIWWKPMESSMEMTLLLRGRRLEAPSDTIRMASDGVTAPMDSRTLGFVAEEAAFPTGVVFPSAGSWVVVATTRRNWGCFIFSVQ